MRPSLEDQLGRKLLKTKDINQAATPYWNKLTDEEKRHWKERAKDHKKSDSFLALKKLMRMRTFDRRNRNDYFKDDTSEETEESPDIDHEDQDFHDPMELPGPVLKAEDEVGKPFTDATQYLGGINVFDMLKDFGNYLAIAKNFDAKHYRREVPNEADQDQVRIMEQTAFGPVTIIPAAAMRDNRRLLRGTRNQDVPINAAYYLTPQRRYVPSGVPSTSHPPMERYRRRSSSFLPPTDIPAPSTFPDQQRRENKKRRFYRNRSYSSSNVFDETSGRPVRYFSGPIKAPEPMYKKRRYYRRTASGSVFPVDSFEMTSQLGDPLAAFQRTPGHQSVIAPGSRHPGIRRPSVHGRSSPHPPVSPPPGPPPPLREQRPRGLRRMYEAPTYTTYPPSSIYRQRGRPYSSNSFKYSALLRAMMKLAQLIVGAVVIGTVCGPTRGRVLHDYAATTRTQGQIAVVIFAATCLIVTAGFLVTVNLAKTSQGWRISDAVFSALATLLYLVCGGVESWYADCYPPFGQIYGTGNLRACRLVEWVIAAIFAFFNMILYAADFGLSLQAGLDFSF